MGFSKIFRSVAKVAGPVLTATTGNPAFMALSAAGNMGGGGTKAPSSGGGITFGDIAPYAAGAMDLFGGLMTNNANASQARANRAFQASMSNTSYRRSVEDLIAAGLNPMLAYANGGASTPSGAQATMQNAVGSGVSRALEARRNKAEIENLNESNKAIQAQTAQSITQSDLNRASTVKAIADAEASRATAASIATQNILQKQAIPGAENKAASDRTWYGRNIRPYLPEFLGGSSSASQIYRNVK